MTYLTDEGSGATQNMVVFTPTPFFSPVFSPNGGGALITSIPEPGSLALLCLGLFGLGLTRDNKSRFMLSNSSLPIV